MDSVQINKTSKMRDSSIELLRIFSMVLIVGHHLAIHGGFDWSGNSISIPHFWIVFLTMGGKIGVNLFVFISGYFLINSKDKVPDLKKILRLFGQVLFFSVLFYFIFVAFGNETINLKSLFAAFFPIGNSTWWFASTYLVMYLFYPYLNTFLHSLDKHTYQRLLILVFFIWAVLPTFTNKTYESNNLLWFFCMYSMAGYARLYGYNSKFKSYQYFLFALFMLLITYLATDGIVVLGTKLEIFADKDRFLYASQRITTMFSTFSIFLGVINLKKPFYNKFVNTVASATFGVYLIHENPYVSNVLWTKVFHCDMYQNRLMLIPLSVFAVLAVFVACTFLELIFQNTIEKLYMVLVNKYADLLNLKLQKMSDYFKKFIFGKE